MSSSIHYTDKQDFLSECNVHDNIITFFLGGFGGFGGRRRRRGEDLVHPLKVSLEDLYIGKTSKLQLTKNVICGQCQGAGGKPGAVRSCGSCNGRGVKVSIRHIGPGMVQQMQSACNVCKGEGEMISQKDKCTTCQGKKTVKENKVLEVYVDKGMKDHQKITFDGEGDQEPGIDAGDVIIILQQKEHEAFKRSGHDLYLEKDITLSEALCGFDMVITHLDKREIKIHCPPGKVIEPGCIRGVEGEGMPIYRRSTTNGNLYIKFNVVFPEKNFLDEDKLKELEKLLPPRPLPPKVGEDVEEVDLEDVGEAGATSSDGRQRHVYEDGSDDEASGHGPRVQCAHQ
ncbi:dnaJ homolog subfamily A member 2-like [Paramuricea clavata]|uniref:DnaJ homolog subfamily A member 2-like n=1 Tax=Paramuricea clavata TaxID=317549 RepID=A0A7D9I8S2_PARCT|nr:dnaJ homolog subfamily A member 2-like [Paramuricea clavata]